MVHSGHFNAIRKSKLLCRELVVGVNSDADIIAFKGPPIMNGEERASMIKACKWVDEVLLDTPYVSDIPLLDSFNCEFVGHGDDIIIGADGRSIYSEFTDIGRMR
jgi:ethanolamine-phosphate cytidylyltransferase